jgi:hypothetical protein
MPRQLKYVADGYNQSCELGGVQIVFRPMTLHERHDLWTLAPNRKLLEEFLQSRIVIGWQHLQIQDLEPMEFRRALDLIFRPGDKQAVEDARNLMEGTKLQATKWGKFNSWDVCGHCQKNWFDPITNVTAMQDGVAIPREGQPLLCDVPGGCPVGHHSKRNSFSPKNKLAYQFHQQCASFESWPDDPIVKQNAELIRRAQNEAMDGNVFKPIL